MNKQQIITQKLTTAFKPSYLQVIDESHMHNVPVGAQSHFKVTIVSNNFNEKMLIARHRLINKALLDELNKSQDNGGIHALALHTFTEQEWQKKDTVPDSPPCLGGGAK